MRTQRERERRERTRELLSLTERERMEEQRESEREYVSCPSAQLDFFSVACFDDLGRQGHF